MGTDVMKRDSGVMWYRVIHENGYGNDMGRKMLYFVNFHSNVEQKICS